MLMMMRRQSLVESPDDDDVGIQNLAYDDDKQLDVGGTTSQAFQVDMSHIDTNTQHTKTKELTEFIYKELGEKGLYLSEDGVKYYVDERNGDITYIPIGR